VKYAIALSLQVETEREQLKDALQTMDYNRALACQMSWNGLRTNYPRHRLGSIAPIATAFVRRSAMEKAAARVFCRVGVQLCTAAGDGEGMSERNRPSHEPSPA
jgi:hypothetical protein